MAVNGASRSRAGVNPYGSGGDVGDTPESRLVFRGTYSQEDQATLRQQYAEWIQWNREVTEILEGWKGDPLFAPEEVQTELATFTAEIDKIKKQNVAMLRRHEDLWAKGELTENEFYTLPEEPSIFVLGLADNLRLQNLITASLEFPSDPQIVVIPQSPQSPPMAIAIPATQSTPSSPTQQKPVEKPAPQVKDVYKPKIFSFGVGAGRSYGNYRYFSPPLAGPRRDPALTRYDAAATSASPAIKGKTDVEFPTLQVQADLHPLAFLQDHGWWDAISILGNFQTVKKSLDHKSAHLQMLQAGVGLNLDAILQNNRSWDISAHAYFFEWGGEALKKKEFREYTRLGGFPFVQTGICGGWNLNENFTLQGCGDWREEGYESKFENMWGKSGASVDFYILSANFLYHFRK